MATILKAEEAAPTQEKFPSVSSVHKTLPITPSGCVVMCLKIIFGMRNAVIMMSATARFVSR